MPWFLPYGEVEVEVMATVTVRAEVNTTAPLLARAPSSNSAALLPT